jgi:cell wall-associated NlpC family hydrolase
MVTRTQLVAEARTWVGTPFVHQGRRRGLGVDCVGLVLCVMRNLGLGDYLAEHAAYPAQPVGTIVLDACRAHLVEKNPAEAEPGDVLLFCVMVDPVHVGIVTEAHAERYGARRIIHAAGGLGVNISKRRKPYRVVEVVLDHKWERRIAACFAIPGVE